ncbi:MAG: hypothetical protein ACOYK8_04110 [Alphaproteobacteria bacterium]
MSRLHYRELPNQLAHQDPNRHLLETEWLMRFIAALSFTQEGRNWLLAAYQENKKIIIAYDQSWWLGIKEGSTKNSLLINPNSFAKEFPYSVFSPKTFLAFAAINNLFWQKDIDLKSGYFQQQIANCETEEERQEVKISRDLRGEFRRWVHWVQQHNMDGSTKTHPWVEIAEYHPAVKLEEFSCQLNDSHFPFAPMLFQQLLSSLTSDETEELSLSAHFNKQMEGRAAFYNATSYEQLHPKFFDIFCTLNRDDTRMQAIHQQATSISSQKKKTTDQAPHPPKAITEKPQHYYHYFRNIYDAWEKTPEGIFYLNHIDSELSTLQPIKPNFSQRMAVVKELITLTQKQTPPSIFQRFVNFVQTKRF